MNASGSETTAEAFKESATVGLAMRYSQSGNRDDGNCMMQPSRCDRSAAYS